jgi:hypothetical protein
MNVLEIRNILGKIVPFETNSMDGDYLRIEFGEIPDGVYFISYSLNNEIFHSTIINRNN